mgnify:CR=1 FL=1
MPFRSMGLDIDHAILEDPHPVDPNAGVLTHSPKRHLTVNAAVKRVWKIRLFEYKMNIEDEEGPGEFAHCSRMYVWHGDGMSVGLHLLPKGVSSEDARGETIANIAYSTLMDLKQFPVDNALVVLHHVPADARVNATLLPVGLEANIQKVKLAFDKDDELFRECLNDVVEKSTTEQCVGVSVMYNTASDLVSASGQLAIVHELGVLANPTEFLEDVRPSST